MVDGEQKSYIYFYILEIFRNLENLGIGFERINHIF